MYVRGKRLHTAVALSNSEGQTAGGTRERQQRRALATTPQGAGRVGVTKGGKFVAYLFARFNERNKMYTWLFLPSFFERSSGRRRLLPVEIMG